MRDLLLGREPADYDVATSATPDVVLDLFPRTFAVGAHFGVVAGLRRRRKMPALSRRWRRSGRIWRIPMGGIPMRCATRRPPRRMCERRDFTINGLLLDPATDVRRAGPSLDRDAVLTQDDDREEKLQLRARR